jgi:hypothetical protein
MLRLVYKQSEKYCCSVSLRKKNGRTANKLANGKHQ